MGEPSCAHCPIRARYDNNPRSLLGRFWKWHIKFCPGWKSYLVSLPDEERREIFRKYGSRKL